MTHNVYIYILIMAGVTYLIRLLPLVLVRREIENVTIKSFLYYVPYVTLSVMTFPAILSATNSVVSGAAGFAAAVVIAFRDGSLIKVAIGACSVVFILELLQTMLII
ncbi:hypothetical protein IMSAG049_00323 [Clostridiales bacterium]|nr:hypothetical protein IMSAG049_00323 [Clostridiales bacterium]